MKHLQDRMISTNQLIHVLYWDAHSSLNIIIQRTMKHLMRSKLTSNLNITYSVWQQMFFNIRKTIPNNNRALGSK